jgi:hypothetical protein
MGGAAGSAFPWSALAQAKVFSIGVLGLGSPPLEPLIEGLRDSLRVVDYSEGRNLKLEVRTAENQTRNLTKLAEELVRLNLSEIAHYMVNRRALRADIHHPRAAWVCKWRRSSPLPKFSLPW